MKPIVVIGGTEFLPGFALAGVQQTVLATEENLFSKVQEHQDAGLIILDGEITGGLEPHQREVIETSVEPVIITLSKHDEEKERMRKAIISTLGVDLFK